MTTDRVKLLNEAGAFSIHTGNLGSWKELQKRTFAYPADELIECIRLQLTKSEHRMVTDNDGNEEILKLYSPYCTPEHHVGRYPRDELKITLKLFLSKPDTETVRRCLLEIKKELQVRFVDQLIIALAPFEESENVVRPSISFQFLSMWPSLEKLVDEGHVVALGCADLDVDDLRRLWDGAQHIKPLVNHYYLSACCSVPSELKDYAKQHDIVLLTHSDSNPFIDVDQLKLAFDDLAPMSSKLDTDFSSESSTFNADAWSVEWVAKYVAMIKARSVIAGKGYVAKFRKFK